jgi:hypothetical protein
MTDLKNASEADPLVADSRVDGFAAQRDVGNGVEIAPVEAVTPVCDVETSVLSFGWPQDDGDLAVRGRRLVSVVSILYQLDEKAIAVVIRYELRYLSHALVQAGIVA